MSKRFERVAAKHHHFARKKTEHRHYGAPPEVRRGGARFENALERDERKLAQENDEYEN